MTDKLLKALHDTAKGLHKAGTLDAMTMREFDALCLPPVKTYTPTQIRRLRTRYKASQAVFAAFLNTSCASRKLISHSIKPPTVRNDDVNHRPLEIVPPFLVLAAAPIATRDSGLSIPSDRCVRQQ